MRLAAILLLLVPAAVPGAWGRDACHGGRAGAACATDATVVVLSCGSGAQLVRGQLPGRRGRLLPSDLIRCETGRAGACEFTWREPCDAGVPEEACGESVVSVDRGSLVALGDGTTTFVFRCRARRSGGPAT